MFLAKHNIPIRGHDESLQSTNPGDFLDLDLKSRDNPLFAGILDQEELQLYFSCISKPAIDIERCISSKHFSIIVYETMDISRVEQVSVVIRFLTVEYDKCMVEEHFIGFWSTHSTTGEALFELLQQILGAVGLCFSNTRAQC